MPFANHPVSRHFPDPRRMCEKSYIEGWVYLGSFELFLFVIFHVHVHFSTFSLSDLQKTKTFYNFETNSIWGIRPEIGRYSDRDCI